MKSKSKLLCLTALLSRFLPLRHSWKCEWKTIALEEWGDISLKICEEENSLINIGGRRRAKRKITSNSRRGKPWCGVKGFRASKIALKWSALFWPSPVKGMLLGTRSQNAASVFCVCVYNVPACVVWTFPSDVLETSYRRIHTAHSSAHVIFIIQYCNRLFSIAVDYNTGLVPKLTRLFSCAKQSCCDRQCCFNQSIS